MPRADASDALLDAAERLFAEQGLATVSDRRVAEAAGNSNHSAVRYYFGGRRGLIEALVLRHEAVLAPRRRELQADADTLLDELRAVIVPQVEFLASAGAPSWRARFLAMAYADPAGMQVIASLNRDPVTGKSVFDAVRCHLPHLDAAVVSGRARLMGHMLVSTCAGLEEREAAGARVEWQLVGWFLSDAIAGMLQGPASEVPEPYASALASGLDLSSSLGQP